MAALTGKPASSLTTSIPVVCQSASTGRSPVGARRRASRWKPTICDRALPFAVALSLLELLFVVAWHPGAASTAARSAGSPSGARDDGRSELVYLAGSRVYHLRTCRHAAARANRKSELVSLASAQEAAEMALRPCAVCNPPPVIIDTAESGG